MNCVQRSVYIYIYYNILGIMLYRIFFFKRGGGGGSKRHCRVKSRKAVAFGKDKFSPYSRSPLHTVWQFLCNYFCNQQKKCLFFQFWSILLRWKKYHLHKRITFRDQFCTVSFIINNESPICYRTQRKEHCPSVFIDIQIIRVYEYV